MHYEIQINRGHYNWVNPYEYNINHRIEIFDDNSKKPTKVLNIVADDDKYLFSEDAEPEEVANALEEYLNSLLFTAQKEEIEDMIKFLREHSEELLKSKLEKELKDLEEKKEEIIERLNSLRR